MKKLSEKKVILFGGSFNPIHIGHLISGFELLEKLNYDFVVFIPTSLPPHKSSYELVSSRDRLKMIKLAIKGIKNFSYSDIDIKRGGVTYTIETVKDFIKKFNPKKLGFVFGEDLLPTLNNWKEIDKLSNLVELICLKRNYEKINFKNEIKISFVDNRIIDISSSEIRERIKKGLPVDFLLPAKVKKYIYKKRLYLNRNKNG